MLFSQERVRLKITQSKVALMVQGYNAIIPRKSKTKNHPVKNSVNSTHAGYNAVFQRRGKTINHPVKISINQSSDILQHSQNRPTGDRWLKF